MGADPEYCDRDQDGKPVLTQHPDKPYAYYTITLTAQWEPRWAVLEYNYDEEGTETQQDAVPVQFNGQATIHADNPEPTDPTTRFAGWWSAKTNTLYQKDDQVPYTSMDCLSGYGAGSYSYSSDGTAPAGEHNVITLQAKYYSNTDTEGSGWLILSSGLNAKPSFDPIQVRLPAGATETELKVVYGQDRETFTVLNGDTVLLSAKSPSVTGADFLGWSLGGEIVEEDTGITVQRDGITTLTGTYQQIPYTITYITNGGPEVIPSGNSFMAGEAVTGPENYSESTTKENGHYQFAGWIPALPEYMPAENLTVNATWIPVTFTVTLDPNGGVFGQGTAGDPKMVISGAYGTGIDRPEEPTLDGSVFCGWKKLTETGEPGDEAEDIPAYMPDDRPTYIAWWRELQAPVIEQDKTTGTSITVEAAEDQEYAIISDPEKIADEDYAPGNNDWVRAEKDAAAITFDGLTPAAPHRIYTRFADVNTAAALSTVKHTDGRTDKLTRKAPAAPVLSSGNRTVTVTNTEPETAEYRIQWNDSTSAWPENIWVSADQSGKGIVYRKETGDGMAELTDEEIKALPYAARMLNGQMTFINLNQDQPFAVTARQKETEIYYRSPESETSTIYTTKTNLTYVEIQGEPGYGQTLTANVDPGVKNDPMLTYRWYRDNELITLPDANGNGIPVSGDRYTVRSADEGHMIRVIAVQEFNSGKRIVKEDAAGPAKKADNNAVPDPVKAKPAPTSLTVTYPVDANGGSLYEYSRDLINWQTDTLFDGLEEETDYSLYVRYAATETKEASRSSEPAEFRTTRILLKTVDILGDTVYGEKLSLEFTPADANGVTWQWFRDIGGESAEPIVDGEGNPHTDSAYILTEKDIGSLIYVIATQPRRDNDPVIREAVTGPVRKAPQDAPETLEAETTDVTLEVTEPLNGDGTEREYEYRINGMDWQDGTLFENLNPDTDYTVFARVKETPTHSASEQISRICRTKKMETEVYEAFQDTEGKWSEPEQASEKVYDAYAVQAREGFTAAGYSLDAYTDSEEERGETAEGEEIPLSQGTRRLYVYYTRNTYQLTFLDGETVLDESTLYYGAAVPALSAPEKKGYDFSRWNPEVPETMPAENLVIRAVWKEGIISTELILGNGVPVISLKDLTDEEVLKIAGPEAAALQKEGAAVTLIIEINDINGTVPAEDKKLVADVLKKKDAEASVLQYLDISVYLVVGGGERVKLTDLNGQDLTLTLVVPEKDRNTKKTITRTFYIVRVHEKKADILSTSTANTQTFRSSLFSTYAVARSDKENGAKTSDESHLGLWISLMALLVAGFVIFNITRRRKNR